MKPSSKLSDDSKATQLIAAAPLLLEALLEITNMPEYDGTPHTSKIRLAAKRKVRAALFAAGV
jgi:hypothetical protein